MVNHMLTTIDNPYNPFTEWEEWYTFDEAAGHHTTGLLARVVITSDEISPTDQSLAIETAIDEIVNENMSGMHRKVAEPD